jgi:hypothetical protein
MNHPFLIMSLSELGFVGFIDYRICEWVISISEISYLYI